ncbi:MAG TPA: peptide methionine sulfoxide reductase [Microbacterium sp.]|nr:peptide methionine sulfoxide reductase [Microbacterium sp.]
MDEATNELNELLRAIPEGWSRTEIDGSGWAVTRTTRAGGKVVSIDAEQLGTAERFGANVWITDDETILRPCEVPEEKVMRFMRAAAAAFSA